MVVTDEKGEPIAIGGTRGPAFEIDKIDGVQIVQDIKLLEVKPNTKNEYLAGDLQSEPSSILPKSLKVDKLPDKRLKAGFRRMFNHKIVTIGASSLTGETTATRQNIETKIIPLDVLRIRMMSDPYNFTIRRQMSDAIFQDPTISPGVAKRNKALYANDFYIDFELKSMLNPLTGQPYTPDETQAVLSAERQSYLTYLLQLDTWRRLPTIDILDKIKRSHVSIISQGRALNLIVPKPAELQVGQLPISVRNITWENTGQVYVDTIYWQVVGVRLFFINKDMASPDEMVYITGRNYGLRWLSDYYGASELEPFLQLSRINRKVLWYNLAKAADNAFMAKILLSVDVQGDQKSRKNQIQALVNSIIAQGEDVIGIENRVGIETVPVSADHEMLKFITETLDDRLISGIGSTRAQMGRTENLNRDTATIMEVENIRNVRTPDEELVGTAFARQLFDPLLASLSGKPIDEIPVRIVIKRIEPTDEAVDPDLEKKLAELKGSSMNKGGDITQEDSGGQDGTMEGTKSFGASRNIIVSREQMLMKLVKDKKGNPIRSQVVKILLTEFAPHTLGASQDYPENNDDDGTEPKQATIEDVKAWASIPNSTMMYHYINPNRWTDRNDYEQIAENAKNFDKLTPDQQMVVIRSFYFRNPSALVSDVLQKYDFKTPDDPSAYCWTVLMPTHKEHLIDPEQRHAWTHAFVQKSYDQLNPIEKDIADRLYVWRHTPHDAKNLKDVEPIPEFPEQTEN